MVEERDRKVGSAGCYARRLRLRHLLRHAYRDEEYWHSTSTTNGCARKRASRSTAATCSSSAASGRSPTRSSFPKRRRRSPCAGGRARSHTAEYYEVIEFPGFVREVHFHPEVVATFFRAPSSTRSARCDTRRGGAVALRPVGRGRLHERRLRPPAPRPHRRAHGRARAQGDLLIVGVNSDASVRRLGVGAECPVRSEAERARTCSPGSPPCRLCGRVRRGHPARIRARACARARCHRQGRRRRRPRASSAPTWARARAAAASSSSRSPRRSTTSIIHRLRRRDRVCVCVYVPAAVRRMRAPPHLAAAWRRAERGGSSSPSATRACSARARARPVSVEDGVPGWKKGKGEGWLTAEYSMLPWGDAHALSARARPGGGRTHEIQRLIGRRARVRATPDDFKFGEFTLKVDCDVLQADGGTRTAAITGAAVRGRRTRSTDGAHRAHRGVAGAPARGRGERRPRRRHTDRGPRVLRGRACPGRTPNVVMSSEGRFVEVQGTGEHAPSRGDLDQLLDLASAGILALHGAQRAALGFT